MKVPVKPTAAQRKALKAKYKANAEKNKQRESERAERFKDDEGAENAIRQLTTSQGYHPDPLKPRGGNFPVKKKKSDSSMRPKYRDL